MSDSNRVPPANMRATLLGVILFTLCSFAVSISPTGYPTTISYDRRAFTINGTRQLLLSGCVHYPRSAPSQWPSILKLTKQAGLDVVQTYVFWNLHQPSGPNDWDFDGRANIWEFLDQCQKAGLFVTLRIGPYVCAEWTLGGIPVWVKNIPGIVFRDYNPQWLDAMGTFVTRFTKEALSRKVFSHQGGPVILAQIENEYGNVESGFSNPHAYINWAAQLAQNLTSAEPWIMCSQEDAPTTPGIVNTCNGFYCDNWLPGHFSSRNTPAAWTENWPGWFQNWGSPKPHRPVQDVAFAVARWVARGGSHMNYYMWHGGTTWGRYTGGPLLVTSYDYDVALNEYGLPHNPKYSHSAALHKVLQTYSRAIIGNPVDPGTNLGNGVSVNVYGDPKQGGANCVAFLSNIDSSNQHQAQWNGHTYTIPAWSVSILGGCGAQVTFNTATIQNQENTIISQMKRVASSTEQNSWSWSWWQDSIGPWTNAPIINNNSPLEQIHVTNDTTDYLWYSTKLQSSGAGSVKYSSNIHNFGLIFVDDRLQSVVRNGQASTQINVPSGQYTLNILTQSVGLQNYDAHYESTITDGLVGGPVSVGGRDITSNGWGHVVGLQGEQLAIWTPQGINKVNWNSNSNGGVNRPLTWWKATFPTPSGTGPLALEFSGLEKGFAYVNGQGIGRYWNIVAGGNCPLCTAIDSKCDYRGTYNSGKCPCDCGVPSQQYYHVPRDWLQPEGQMNTLVLIEEVGASDVTKVSLVTPPAPPA